LLDHAMVTFRTDHLETSTLDIVELVRDTCRALSPTADIKDILIKLEIPDATLPFSGDPILLHSALRNILDNAIKYSPADSDIVVRVEVDASYKISVIDQGRGFGNSDLKHLTTRFSRGSNVEDVVGSGLGLTIVDEVIRAHGGNIEISENTGGTGACVSLNLPLP